jgi:formate C-acetyltransferase
MNDCIDNKKDFTACGTKYKDDSYMCVGFPNIVDSLLVIKKLCFDEKKYTLKELLSAVRNNWKDNEGMRIDAIACPGWGDGSDESCSLARRFNTSLYDMLSKLTGIHGGKIHLGHMTYTEIRFWGEKTLATPDGRYDGDYFSQGLTPSRLKKIPNVTDVIRSMGALDKTELSGNNVINIILPGTTPVAVCESFLRTVAETAVESLQLNCVSKETLLDAQKNPDKYPDLIVRVCGFSAKFTSLSPEWQQEVLTRNFYEN